MNLIRKLAILFIPDLTPSILYNEDTFYKQFLHDLSKAKKEVVIESPYITSKRMNVLFPVLDKLTRKGIKIYIITRNPKEHEGDMALQAAREIRECEYIGIKVLFCRGNHHRKLAMLDRKITWEGSLNILSQCYSREFMRRIESKRLTQELFQFLGFDRHEAFKRNWIWYN